MERGLGGGQRGDGKASSEAVQGERWWWQRGEAEGSWGGEGAGARGAPEGAVRKHVLCRLLR